MAEVDPMSTLGQPSGQRTGNTNRHRSYDPTSDGVIAM